MKKIFITLAVLIWALGAGSALAQSQVMEASHTYVLGDNDSKNDARTICFLEAKRKLIEKAGVLVIGHSQTEGGLLTKDQINSYTAALIKIIQSGEKWGITNSGSMAITLKVKARVDLKDIGKRLKALQHDTKAQETISQQQKRLNDLENKVASLQLKLGQAKAIDASQLRKERNIVFQNIAELQQRKITIVENIEQLSDKVENLIEAGMNKREVVSLVGNPRTSANKGGNPIGWNYGKVWINFENDIVTKVYKSSRFTMFP